MNDANRRSVSVVRSQRHHPSKRALDDGGYSAARESVEISWAAPLEGAPKGIGRFWAYFPTASLTTLSGIVNAPWKLADDRESLLAGEFNEELLSEVLPKLVGDALASIHRPDKPTAVLDVMPARGKEWRNWADNLLNEPVMRAISERQCIPTLAGGLRHPTRVKLHPEGLTQDELELWASVCPDPDAWVSHAVLSNEHRSKVERLLGYHRRDAVTLRQWVEHLVKDPTEEGSAAAVRLVASLIGRLRDRTDLVAELKKARVLLLEDGSVDACRRGQVFLPGPTPVDGRLVINMVVAANPEVVSALKSLGIEIFDNAGELRSELTERELRWDRVWAASERTRSTSPRPSSETSSVSDPRPTASANVLGQVEGPGRRLSRGDIIPADGSRDGDFLVDPRFHVQDLAPPAALGFVSKPRTPRVTAAWRRGVSAREDDVRDLFRRQQARPDFRTRPSTSTRGGCSGRSSRCRGSRTKVVVR